MRLSARAWEILLTIDETCEHQTDGMFWTPALYAGCCRGNDDWCDMLGYFVNINGSGDARIIKSLRDKGLIAKVASKGGTLNQYASRITEDGRLLIERGLEQRSIPLRFKD